MYSLSNPQFIRKSIPYSFRVFSVFSSGLDEIDKSLYLHDGFYKDWASPDLFRIAKHNISFLRRKVAPLMQQLNNNGMFNDVAQIYMFSDYDRLQMMKLGMHNLMIDLFLFKMDVQDAFYLKYDFDLQEIKNELDFYSMNKQFSSKIHQDKFLFKIEKALDFCKQLNKNYLGFLIDKFKKQGLSFFVDFLQHEQVLNEMKDVCFFYNDDFLLKGDFFFYQDFQGIKCDLKALKIVEFENEKLYDASFLINYFNRYNLDFLDFNRLQINYILNFYKSGLSCNELLFDKHIQQFLMVFLNENMNS